MALPSTSRVASVVLRTRDPERVAGLYEGVLGLARTAASADDGAIALAAAPGAAPLLVLRPLAPGAPATTDPRAPGLFHTALRYPERPLLADALRRVIAAGGRLDGASDHGVSEALYLRDPEGNGVELYCDRPREVWPRKPDGGLDMYTAALDLHDLLAQVPDAPAPMDPRTDVGHAHLRVSRLPRSEAFWTDVIGFELQTHYGDQAAFVSAGGYHHHIGLNTWASAGSPPPPAGSPGLDAVALEVPDAAVVDALERRAGAAGVAVERHEDGALLLRDPDEIAVRVVAAAGEASP